MKILNIDVPTEISFRFGDWKIGKTIDEGGFGKVYIATSISDPKKVAALKAESNEIEGGSAIKLEVLILCRRLTMNVFATSYAQKSCHVEQQITVAG